MSNVTDRSCYTPFWAGIENNWYKNAALDAVWKPEYDKLVEELVDRRAPYIYPFAGDVLRVVDRENNTSFSSENQNCGYYILTRAYQMPHTRQKWLDAVKREETHVHVCPICKTQNHLLHFHPDILREYGTNPPWCRTCNYVVRRYTKFWNEDTKQRLGVMMTRLDEACPCDICGASFSLAEHVFTYYSFGGKAVDLLYPNLFANICPDCFGKAFFDYRRGSPRKRLTALYDLFLFIGKVPTRDFENLFYLYRDRESIVKLVSLLQRMRTPSGYAEEFGSFFAALVKSGVLPEGSKKMVIGTMTLSKDGHLCLSLPEKEIDDFLLAEGIAHDKEVSYPAYSFRADWELFGSKGRTFVEYFGLMSNPDYAAKAKVKTEIALAAGIELIAMFPGTDWKAMMLNWKKNNVSGKERLDAPPQANPFVKAEREGKAEKQEEML
jgi:hypothetical protein